MALGGSNGIDGGHLRSFIDRIERMEVEKAVIAEDIRAIYAEAKGTGFDVEILRRIIAIRKMDADEHRAQQEMIDLYMSALGDLRDMPLGQAADRIEQLENGFVDILSQQPLDLVVAVIAKSCLVGAIDKNGKYCFVGNLKIVDGKPLMGKTDD